MNCSVQYKESNIEKGNINSVLLWGTRIKIHQIKRHDLNYDSVQDKCVRDKHDCTGTIVQ